MVNTVGWPQVPLPADAESGSRDWVRLNSSYLVQATDTGSRARNRGVEWPSLRIGCSSHPPREHSATTACSGPPGLKGRGTDSVASRTSQFVSVGTQHENASLVGKDCDCPGGRSMLQ